MSQSSAAATSNMLVLFAVMLGSGLTVGTVLFREAERRKFAELEDAAPNPVHRRRR